MKPSVKLKKSDKKHKTVSILINRIQQCENLYLPDLNGQTRKLHSVLTYQMENQRLGCINRDNNGRQNMKKLFDHYMIFGNRPWKYRRGTVL